MDAPPVMTQFAQDVIVQILNARSVLAFMFWQLSHEVSRQRSSAGNSTALIVFRQSCRHHVQ
jgi:hypothetical protein